MFRWLRRRRNGRDGRVSAITGCCDCGVEMKFVGNECFVVCSGCGEYIGHLVGRETALIALRFKHHLNVAVAATGERYEFFEADLDVMADAYIARLTTWAPQAARDVLAEHGVPEEVDQ